MKEDVVVVVPSLNEVENIGLVIGEMLNSGLKKIVIGVDVNTCDGTEELLDKLKIKWVKGTKTGYDGSVAAGIEGVKKWYGNVKYILFADAGGKHSFGVVEEMIAKKSQLVLGVRIGEKRHMLWHQKIGTQLVLWPINLIFGQKILDISPFRLVEAKLVEELDMKTNNFSWTTQMLVKALARRVKVVQVPVRLYSRRGKSKISGSWKNSVRAGIEMIGSLRYVLS